MTDKVTMNSSWADLEKQAKGLRPGPFVQGLPGNKRVTFPDPMAMGFEDFERFAFELTSGMNSTGLKAWLPESEYAKIADLDTAQCIVLVRRATAHYESIKDAVGEPDASQS